MRTRISLILIGAVAALAVLIAGCGGSDDNTSETASVTVETSSLSKAAFLKRASEICQAETESIVEEVRNAITTEANVEPVERVVQPVVESVIGRIQALGAPSGEQQWVEELLTALQADLDTSKQSPSDSMEAFAGKFRQSGDIARQHRLDSCAFG